MQHIRQTYPQLNNYLRFFSAVHLAVVQGRFGNSDGYRTGPCLFESTVAVVVQIDRDLWNSILADIRLMLLRPVFCTAVSIC